jgi:hypothetical protein
VVVKTLRNTPFLNPSPQGGRIKDHERKTALAGPLVNNFDWSP